MKKGASGKSGKPLKRASKTKKPMARLPLPKKGEKRHEDRTKYERAREKDRLRHELGR
ncbi:MAG: hypothetical protein M3542_12280 [Acidobacteriota bacterium]|nr:hypothetical protein [Acidobacteriota bacterium]MDQ5872099.1 hypothetical protein [Acidobacteriota bacterium]